jgi:hypothetical protein
MRGSSSFLEINFHLLAVYSVGGQGNRMAQEMFNLILLLKSYYSLLAAQKSRQITSLNCILENTG